VQEMDLGQIQLELPLGLDGVDEKAQPLEIDGPLALALLDVLEIEDLELYVPGLREPAGQKTLRGVGFGGVGGRITLEN